MELIITGCLPSWRVPHQGIAGEGRAESRTARPRGGILEWQRGWDAFQPRTGALSIPNLPARPRPGLGSFSSLFIQTRPPARPPPNTHAHTLRPCCAADHPPQPASRPPAFPALFVLKLGGTPGLPCHHLPIRRQDPVFLSADTVLRNGTLAI